MDIIGLGVGPTGSITYLLTGGLNIGAVITDTPGRATPSDTTSYSVALADALYGAVTIADAAIGAVTLGDTDNG